MVTLPQLLTFILDNTVTMHYDNFQVNKWAETVCALIPNVGFGLRFQPVDATRYYL
jgi:hypothetical protein